MPDFSAYLGPNPDPAHMAYIEICPSIGNYRKAWDDARHGRITDSPVMHIQIPSALDRSLVPNGGHVMSIWALYAPVKPYGHGSSEWTEELTRRAGDVFISTLEPYAPNIRRVIRDWGMFTPADIERGCVPKVL